MKKHADSIDAAILDRIRSGPQDRVWTPPDFIDLGSRAAVDKALSRNCQNGSIRRAGRGLYHLPRHDPVLGVLGPSYHAMQDLIRRKAGGDVFPTGASAANALVAARLSGTVGKYESCQSSVVLPNEAKN